MALRPWLIQITERYKNRMIPAGESSGTVVMPVIPMVILPSYYTDTSDKEIAAFASLLIPDNEHVIKNIGEFRELLGGNPCVWFRNRAFVTLGTGAMQRKRTGGVENWKIARLMDRMWYECFVRTRTHDTIRAMVADIVEYERCSYFDALTWIVEGCGVGDYFYKLRMLLMVMCTEDGLGLGLWKEDPMENHREQWLCPLTHDLRVFLQTWFPDHRRYGTIDEAIRLFGFERDCDFFYAWLAYKELQKKSPKVCSEFSTTYLNWYNKGVMKKPYLFRRLVPEI